MIARHRTWCKTHEKTKESRKTKNTMKLKLTTTALTFSLALFSQGASTIVNGDIGTGPLYSGAGAASFGGVSQTWNQITADTTDLLDSNGAATTIDITFQTGFFFSVGDAGLAANPNLGGAPDLMRDYRTRGGGNIWSLNFFGLEPDATFTLYLYALGDNANQTGTIAAKAGDNATFSTTLPITNTGGSSQTTLVEGVHYVIIEGTIGSTGQISFDLNGSDPSPFAAVNGFQLEVVPIPEPSTALLSFLALAGLVTFRRRS